MRGRGSDVGIF